MIRSDIYRYRNDIYGVDVFAALLRTQLQYRKTTLRTAADVTGASCSCRISVHRYTLPVLSELHRSR